MLRHRIVGAVCAALLLFAGALTVLSLQREAAVQARYVEARLAAQRAIWSTLVSDQLDSMARAIDGLAGDPPLIDALTKNDRDAVARWIEPALAGLTAQGIADRVEVTDTKGALVYSSGQAQFIEPILDASSPAQLAAIAGKTDGLGHDSADGLVAAVAMPIHDGEGRPAGILTLAAGMGDTLHRFARAVDGAAAIASRRGRILLTTDRSLPEALADADRWISPGAIELRSAGTRRYEVTALPIDTFTGAGTAILIGMVDATATAQEQARLDRMTLAALGAGALLAFVLLLQALGRAFAPLDRAIASLRALSEGDMSVPLEIEQRRDESGRIAQAIEAFREHLILGERLKRSREKQHRRQQRLIHRQMTKLADTLEQEARDAVLQDLAEIEASAERAKAADAADGADGLSTAALTLEKLTGRLIEQHRKLDGLVVELRDALKTRTAFIALQQELDIAQKIQQSILPESVDPRPEFSICGRMIPAKEVGGDFYDFFYIAPNRLAVAIADVSGKGVPAAFFMAIARTMLKAIALLTDRPSDCVGKLNDLLSADDNQGMFVTLVYGVLDLDNGRFTYVNAGHNAPVLVDADGAAAPLDYTNGMALAVLEGQTYREQEITLRAGDTVFLYTDGITEATNAEGALFSEDRLVAHLRDKGAACVEDVADAVIAAVKTFEQEAEQADDISCVVLRLQDTGRALTLAAE